MKKLISLTLLMIISIGYSHATTYEACFKSASEKYGVPLKILLAISFTESSFNHKSLNHNRNGTKDYGLMQINSFWAKHAAGMGYEWSQVKHDPCTNVMFGSRILKDNRRRLGTWEAAIGAYNAGFAKTAKARKLRARYYKKVMRNRLIAQRNIDKLKKKLNS